MDAIMDCPRCGEPGTLAQNANGAHDGTWVCTTCSVEIFGFMDCPVCGEPDGLFKRVNEDHDEIWMCRECPAVLFTYWLPSSIDRLRRELEPGPSGAIPPAFVCR